MVSWERNDRREETRRDRGSTVPDEDLERKGDPSPPLPERGVRMPSSLTDANARRIETMPNFPSSRGRLGADTDEELGERESPKGLGRSYVCLVFFTNDSEREREIQVHVHARAFTPRFHRKGTMKTMRNRSRFRSERKDRSILARSTSLSTPSEASRLLLVASKDRTIPPKDVYGAMRALDRARIAKSDDFERMAGERGPGRAWRLVFTSSAEQIRDEMRGKGRGGGTYFPLVAGQQWDPERMMMRNGVFLGHWASMIFEGPVEVRGTKMRFDFYDLEIRVGPWKKSFRIKQPPDEKERKLGPFFVRCYVDEDIMVMRGKGGGIALWSRATEKDLKEGLIFS